MLQALDFMLSSPLELVVAGDPNKPDTQKILRIINRRFMPSKILLLRDSVKEDSELYDLIPFVQNHKESMVKPLSMHVVIKLATTQERTLKKSRNSSANQTKINLSSYPYVGIRWKRSWDNKQLQKSQLQQTPQPICFDSEKRKYFVPYVSITVTRNQSSHPR